MKITTLSLLGVAFVVLRLCGVIAWSWWWVTAPFWIPLTLQFLYLWRKYYVEEVAIQESRARLDEIKRKVRALSPPK